MKALVARVKGLLLSPRTEWDAIAREEIPLRRLVLGYVVPLVAIPTIATLVGLAFIGAQVGGAQVKAPFLSVALSAALFFVLAVGAVLALALVVDWLAPRFRAARSYPQALKVVAYSITAAGVAGVLTVMPALGVLALLGAVYSLYLLFIGTPKVMHAPPETAVNYSIVTTLAAVVLGLGVGLASMGVTGPAGGLFPQIAQFPDLSRESAAQPLAESATIEPAALPPAAGQLREAGPGAVLGGDLRGAAPAVLAGLSRVSVGVERRGLTGAQTVELDAEYRKGRRYIVLQIVYSDTIAETIGFAGPSTSEYDRETSDGYARRRRIGSAIVTEEWNQSSRTGNYARLYDDRFYVKATGGGGISPADLRTAVELFGQQTLAQFAEQS
ncbi:MAG TPA: Yip1 family protein [Hyphomonadaceae bacterium]|jgi:hypothetical protein